MTYQPVIEIESMPPDLVREPLNWLFAEHYRHRQLCKIIEAIAKSEAFDEPRTTAALTYLKTDMPLHVLDEEEDLFPLMRRRAQPDDDLERILGDLGADHHSDAERVKFLIEGLELALKTKTSPASDDVLRPLLLEFVAHERRHVALENAIVLPIARLRLTPEDLKALSRRLAARRGVHLPEDGADARNA
jgi:iron-sulfur cluster repair protein YtfE (RIC family)